MDSLKGNQLTVASFQMDGRGLGLPLLTRLRSLDLSNNPLELGVPMNRQNFFPLLHGLPHLVAIGLAGTWSDTGKALTREQRLTYIRLLPTLADPLSLLRYVRSASCRMSAPSRITRCRASAAGGPVTQVFPVGTLMAGVVGVRLNIV